MKMSSQEFIDWPSKRITLLAMSGAGKTSYQNPNGFITPVIIALERDTYVNLF